MGEWRSRLARNAPFIALHNAQLVGFADLQADGYIDQFFVHHRWQGKGVGKLLMTTLETRAREMRLGELTSNVSITARPFFEARGFVVTCIQQVCGGTTTFINYRMAKALGPI